MKTEKSRFFSARNITFLAVLVALVVVLQVLGGYFKIGATSLSFVLVPIVLGGIMLGAWAGALLGLIFGFIVLMYGVTGADPFTAILLGDYPAWTSVLCLLKGAVAGFVSGILYKLISKKSSYAGVFVASAAAPIVNTGLFILGALLMSDTLSENFVSDGQTVIYFLIIGCAGVNFLIELAINLVLSPAVYTVDRVVEKQLMKKHPKKKEESEGAQSDNMS